ncbi:ABC transporter ATP-binding protein [Actinotalea sp. M2MS4P-6]|uniref:ABC transporter ATP-binding protein n=1 Tax=Actinotalea sp. M2MS4P-6 TaxID=2983762 RepID=UPI0021E44277|nr:ABC transporter ATP-binding protein [Actinotalea sp. M2MS4P-6]MCV2392979.1 ABC transporter ATP-binding protein [Actinotalea sp. M2MS4P-6]
MTAPLTAPVLSMTGVRRAFGPEQALDGVDLTLEPGEIHALVGLNGAGKTTLMRIALGMLRADAGSVRLDVGAGPVNPLGAPPATWRRVGHLIETPFAYPELTVRETVRCAALLHGLARPAAGPAADRVLAELALDHWADRRTQTLSLGNRQRVGLACAVVHEPRLMVLDEPSNALDPAGVVRVRRWLADAVARGAAALVSSHHLDEMARLADRITVLHRGRVVGTLDPQSADLERQFFAMVYAEEAA